MKSLISPEKRREWESAEGEKRSVSQPPDCHISYVVVPCVFDPILTFGARASQS